MRVMMCCSTQCGVDWEFGEEVYALCEVDTKLSCGLNKAMAKAAMERLQFTRVQLVAAKG